MNGLKNCLSRRIAGALLVLVGSVVSAWQVGRAAPEEAKPPLTAQSLEARFKADVRPLLERYCFDCHADGMHKGDVTLDKYTDLSSVQRAGKTWRHLSEVLSQHVMPPKKKKQPTAEEVAKITGWVAQALTWYDPAAPRDPGHVTIRRLNRNEYNNTVRDLVGVKDFKPADDFPADDTGYGFDNIADVLSMSPLLAEKYVGAAEQVLDQAILTRNPFERVTRRYDASKLEARGEGNTGGNLTKNGSTFTRHTFPCDGEYELRIRASQDPFGDEPAKMVIRLDRNELKTFEVKNARGAKQEVYTLKIDAKAGEHRVVAAYTNNKVDNDNPDEKKRGDRNLYVDFIEIDGPLKPPPPPLPESHKRIFVKSPGDGGVSEEQAARAIVEHFATRAFRRPATKDEVDGLMKLYKLARAQGDNHEASVKLALTGVLVSPHFLFRIEADPPEAGDRPHALSDYELATRLSYFLWSSMPDEELFDLARSGKLHEKDALEKQVKRMLADPKSAAFVSNFVGQWLETRNLDSYSPDPKKYPNFDDSLRNAMREEVELFFQTVLREDRSLLELVNADWTMLNERLARHYGIDGVKGNDFRKVPLADKRRGGVLTMAGVLTVTAMPTRTSPVKRGKFVLEKMLAAAPPPPPADVPPLDEKPEAAKAASVRERLEAHRANPNCAVCHVKMDAIGFSLENFDAVGRWRDKDEAGHPIDASGKLPDGETLTGAADLKKVLLDDKPQFVHCLIENTLTYALGRGLEYYDQATVNDIAEKVRKDDYKLSGLVMAVVESEAFQQRRAKRAGE